MEKRLNPCPQKIWFLYTVVPLSAGDTLQALQWLPEIPDNTEPYIYYVFSLYIHNSGSLIYKLDPVRD